MARRRSRALLPAALIAGALGLAACSATPAATTSGTAPAPQVHPHLPPNGVGQPFAVQVKQALPVVTVSASPPVAIVGEPVTLRATLTLAAHPTGTISFFDNGVPIPGCQALPVSSSPPYVATCTQTYVTVSTQVITATYSGDSNNKAAVSAPYPLGVATSTSIHGYWEVASDGGIFSFGDAQFYGSMGGHPLNEPVVAMESTADGRGYWMVASDGGVFAFGDAGFYGSMGGKPLNKPVAAIVATADGKGYWLVASDGGVFAFGDARFHGSTASAVLHDPVVGLAPTPDNRGYWLVTATGVVVAMGDAEFYGSMGELPLNKPIVGIASTPDGHGYWLVASDGGIFAIGDAGFYGSLGITYLNAPVVGMASTGDGKGYWEVARDGGMFAVGDAGYFGSMGGHPLNQPVVGMAALPSIFVLP